MINTLSDLLKAFVEAEKTALNKYNIKHRPTIGEMYEGLTMELVNRSIFSGLNLVVSTQSFIEGCDTEFDVILAEGDGEIVPYTTSKKYQPSQVIAVFQVKKNLTSQELRNSYDNLKQVARVFHDNITDIDASMVRDSLINICHKEMAAYEKRQLSPQEESIYHTLVMDSFFPLRIILGYNGYKTEVGLRDAFVNFLDDNTSTETTKKTGFSPLTFPNLIISDGFSLVKLTGCPYCSSLKEADDWWEVVASTHNNPMHVFLEMLWTKLAYRFHNLPQEIFGDDLETELFSSFLNAKIHLNKNGEPIGWDFGYIYLDEKTLLQNTGLREWTPAIVDKAQTVVLNRLGNYNIDISQHKDLEEFVLQNGYATIQDFITSLEKLGFVTLDGSVLKLITKQLICVISPDGNTYAADDYDGRLTRWMLKKQMGKE